MSIAVLAGIIASSVSRPSGGVPIGPYVPEVIGSHRYWSILINNTDSRNNNLPGISEIEFRGTVGGADLTTPGGPLTMSFPVRDGSVAAMIDGNATTTYCQWVANALGAGVKNRIQYDFTTPVYIAEVAIAPNKDAVNRSPADYTIDYSDDGVTWTTGPRVIMRPGTYTAVGTFVAVDLRPPDDSDAQYWLMDKIISSAPTSIAEIQLHETIGGADITSPTNLVYSNDVYSGSYEPIKAFDNDLDTFWAASNTSGAYIMIDLDSGVTSDCIEVSLTSRDGSATQAIRSGEMWFSKAGRCYWKRGSFSVPAFTNPQTTHVDQLVWP